MRFPRFLICSLSIILSAATSRAQVYTPRVNNDRLPDYTDISRFVDFSQWRSLPQAAKAFELWSCLTDSVTGLYPIQGIYEDPDPGPEFSFFDERDLVKVLNVYGHGYCGLLSPTLDGVYAAAGFSDSRIFNMRENSHCVTEVFYDDGWHYFDMDLRGVLFRPDGMVASLKEAQTVRGLWTDPQIKIEPFYPLDDKAQMYQSFSGCFVTPMYHWYKNGHTMDFSLRPGETLTRYWRPQGSRWHDPWTNPGGFDLSFIRKKFEQEPRGLKSKHDGWSKWTHGNALFSYSPRLTDDYEDFERGVYDSQGVKLTAAGVESVPEKGRNYVVFEVRTPYIIVGKVHEIDRPDKIDDAAKLYFRSLGPLMVSVSTDNGLTWTGLGGVEYEQSALLDLTRQVLGKYGYLVRFDFGAGRSGLAELILVTWCQLAPVSLPRVLEGENHFQFSLGDRHGYPSTVREVRLNLRDPAELARHAVSLSADYQPLRDSAKLKGEVVLKIDSKPNTVIKWFTAGGYFNTFTGKKAAKTANAIYYSTAGPTGPWNLAVKAKVPDWAAHWHYGMDEDVVLPNAVAAVWLKYAGDPGVNQIWVYAHCLPRALPDAATLRVTQAYTINGEPVERTFEFTGKQEYDIDCPGAVENSFIRFALPSQPAAR